MDFQRSVHAFRYVLFLSSWDEKGAAHKYQGHQRMMYIITFYCIALAAITGFIALSGWWEDMGTFLHVVAGIMVILIFLYRLVYVFRKRDWIAWRSIFVTGKMPVWYVKMAHPRWYEEITPASQPERGIEKEPPAEGEPLAEGEPPAEREPPTESDRPRPDAEAAG
jgi:cytochrome b subunit of formate dehydrogenase